MNKATKPVNLQNFFKIFIPLVRDEDGYPPVDVESLWAEKVDEGYRIDNTPFYAPSLAYGDIVSAEIANGRLEATGVVHRSGHGTIRIIAQDVSYMPRIKDELIAFGCAFEEGPMPTFLAVDIPPMQDYTKIVIWIDSSFRGNRFDYEGALIWWDDPA